MKPEEYENCSLRPDAIRVMTREQCRQARICWWCGKALTGRQVYWCDGDCVREWRAAHDWTTARGLAMLRANGLCLRCGAPAEEVNHRVPLVGRGYHSGCVHHPDNLEPLCHDCHTVETTKQLYDRKLADSAAGRDYLGRRARKRLGLRPLPPYATAEDIARIDGLPT
jgi:hypothetical protein